MEEERESAYGVDEGLRHKEGMRMTGRTDNLQKLIYSTESFRLRQGRPRGHGKILFWRGEMGEPSLQRRLSLKVT